ncbi:MAG TPA: hypothetical protein VHZ28_01395 [Terracidiphilus sp.]|nr:hypothetical protein [Terracidiphilus sp.]
MKISTWMGRSIASFLAVLMLFSLGDPAARAQQAPAQVTEPQGTAAPVSPEPSRPKEELAANESVAASSIPDAPTPQTEQSNAPAASQSGTAPAKTSPPADPPQQETRPLGTAAAPETKPTGVTGSRPAGAVIAPAKQRRAHAILISVGLLAGAGIAIGSVAALSKGSPSRP